MLFLQIYDPYRKLILFNRGAKRHIKLHQPFSTNHQLQIKDILSPIL